MRIGVGRSQRHYSSPESLEPESDHASVIRGDVASRYFVNEAREVVEERAESEAAETKRGDHQYHRGALDAVVIEVTAIERSSCLIRRMVIV